jgi:hypothetical protein
MGSQGTPELDCMGKRYPAHAIPVKHVVKFLFACRVIGNGPVLAISTDEDNWDA